jgi:hypothetical protein
MERLMCADMAMGPSRKAMAAAAARKAAEQPPGEPTPKKSSKPDLTIGRPLQRPRDQGNYPAQELNHGIHSRPTASAKPGHCTRRDCAPLYGVGPWPVLECAEWPCKSGRRITWHEIR